MIRFDVRPRWLLLMSIAAFLTASVAGAEEKWKSLFDGKSLGEWKITDNFDFENHGKIEVKDGTIAIGPGKPG